MIKDKKPEAIDDADLEVAQGGLGNFNIQDLVRSGKPDKQLGNFEIQRMAKQPKSRMEVVNEDE